MKRVLTLVSKDGFTPPKLEHWLLLGFGAVVSLASGTYHSLGPVAQLIVLVVYLGLLIGIAPVGMPVFKSKFTQVMYAGIISGVLDSFIVLITARGLRTVEWADGERRESTAVEGERAKFLALCQMAALVGGLIIWFGEVYAAGLYNNDNRTGPLSALFVVPPVLVFISALGLHASRLKLEVVRPDEQKWGTRDIAEFAAGIILLLATHNPLLCLGLLLVYSMITRQDDKLISSWRHETEINVMLVLLIALVAGSSIVAFITRLGFGTGAILPIVPAAIQAVLWGPLYNDPSVHFWTRVLTLSTGALLLPISSLVGVMVFQTGRQWLTYMKYSFAYAALWYVILFTWIRFALDTPVGRFLEQWAHSGSH